MNDISITGNLVSEPLKKVFGDKTLAQLRLAHTPRRRDADGWKDGETTYIDVTCWNRLALNVCATLGRGSAVIVVGRLQSKDKGGEDGSPRRTFYEIVASAVGPDLNAVAMQPLPVKGEGAQRQEETALAEVTSIATDPYLASAS